MALPLLQEQLLLLECIPGQLFSNKVILVFRKVTNSAQYVNEQKTFVLQTILVAHNSL